MSMRFFLSSKKNFFIDEKKFKKNSFFCYCTLKKIFICIRIAQKNQHNQGL